MPLGHECASSGPGSVTFALRRVPTLAPASGSNAVAGSAIALLPRDEKMRSLLEAQVTSGATNKTTAMSVLRDDCNFDLSEISTSERS